MIISSINMTSKIIEENKSSQEYCERIVLCVLKLRESKHESLVEEAKGELISFHECISSNSFIVNRFFLLHVCATAH